MLDFYGNYPQPPPVEREERLKAWLESATKAHPGQSWLTKHTNEVNKMIKKVIDTAPEFSLSGYGVFGFSQNKEELHKKLKEKFQDEFTNLVMDEKGNAFVMKDGIHPTNASDFKARLVRRLYYEPI